MECQSFNRAVVSRAALAHNYRAVKEKTRGDIPVMAMVKADGYGHGMEEAAKVFSSTGCEKFGVAELREGVLLRKTGTAGEIFVTLGFDHDEADLLFKYDLTPVIYDIGSARCLEQQALACGKLVDVHIKIDSGMSRLGLFPGELPGFAEAVSQLKNIRIAGLMSHFPESDDPGAASTLRGFAAFNSVCRELKNRYGAICHIANSGAVLNFPDTHCDMVRAGISLYGYHPGGVRNCPEGTILKPAMSFTTRVLQVKTVPPGQGISYGHTYVTEKATKVAVLPVGYEDGYRRTLSNTGRVLIHGEFAPVIGRVCMNMCMVDVSSIAGAGQGDEVVILGRQGDKIITADDLAEQIDTISYEVLCNVGSSNRRIYID